MGRRFSEGAASLPPGINASIAAKRRPNEKLSEFFTRVPYTDNNGISLIDGKPKAIISHNDN